MYVVNERVGFIINTDFVAEFFLNSTPDSTMFSMRWEGTDQQKMLERYKTRDEAEYAMGELIRALADDRALFYMPESLYYFEERLVQDARTKRRGGS